MEKIKKGTRLGVELEYNIKSHDQDDFTKKLKCELRYKRGASQYLKKEHFRQRNVCAKAGLQLMCLKNMHEAGVYGTG